MEPYGPVARCRDLVILEIEELIGRHIVWHDITTMCFHHHWEDKAMKHDIILAEEMHELGFFVLPPFLPCAPFLGIGIAEFLSIGDITYWCVKPYIEHLTLCTLHGHWYSPVEVAGHSPGLQVHIEPRLALAIHIGAPLLMVFQYPLLEPVLIFVQWQIPVLGRFLHQSMSRIILVGRID